MDQYRHPGQIVFYLPDKKYGYVRLTGTLEEFHFRAANLRYAEPHSGDPITFTLHKTNRGYVADDITPAGLA